MNTSELASLSSLLAGGAEDRAFLDATLRMRWARAIDPHERDALANMHDALIEAARRAQREPHEGIRAGRLRGSALRRVIEAQPFDRRDHFVEELFGIAYPPLDEPAVGRERMPYLPSGYDEVMHAIETTKLRAGQRFVDVGSGMGKVVMLAACIGGAEAFGVEQEPALHDLARDAARALALPATFACGDATDIDVADADVVFLYIPFTGDTLRTTLDRFMQRANESPRTRHLCASALDRGAYPALVPVGEPRSWMQVYAWG